MVPIDQSIQVDATVAEVESAWPRFMEWVLVGPRKLACDELVCVDPRQSGVVHFEEHGDGRSLVIFQVELPRAAGTSDGDPSSNGVEDKLRHDLLLFKEYVENDERGSGDAARQTAAASLRKEKQRGRMFRRSGRDTEPGLPARPSSQAR